MALQRPGTLIRSVSIRAPKADELARDLLRYAAVAEAGARFKIRHYGAKLHAKVVAHASQGRPGLLVRTGDYISRIKVDDRGSTRGHAQVRVYSEHPGANRLEFGFVGQDSLGREYNQPPYPHFGPALSEMEAEVLAGFFLDDSWIYGGIRERKVT